MLNKVLFLTILAINTALGLKDPDEGNPYEFGFTIDGQQHRHEKKDVRGIIQGEFGFITADGIYHVTVYATDENGDFHILSMKNLRISAPLDGSPFKGEISPEANKYRKQANLPPLPPSQPAPNALSIPQPAPQQVITTPKSEAPFKFTTQPTIKPACASCGYITTQKPQPGQSSFPFQNSIFQKQDQNKQTFGTQNAQPLPAQYDNAAGTSGQQNGGNSGQYFQQGAGEEQGGVQTQEGLNPQNIQDTQNYVGGPQGIQQPLSPQAPGGIPAYQAAIGPQNTNYTPFGGTQGTQYPAGGQGNQNQITGENPPQFTGGSGSQNQIGDGQITQGPGGNGQGFTAGNVGVSNLGTSGYNAGGNGGQGNVGAGNYGGSGQLGGSIPFGNAGFPQGSGLGGGNIPGYQQGGSPLPNPLQILGQERPHTQLSSLPPISVSDNSIHVGGERQQDIPIKDKFPGMQEGLPEGINEKDITDLLYKFHYTVGFHGHYEKGLKNGAKIGGYFVNGRDGISRVVTYVADENGYRPKVKFINLGLDSEDTPKPETEKTFGLKDFEFVWYPI